MATSFTIKDSFHYYHRGVDSRPEWAVNDAQTRIATKWAEFMRAIPDTSNVKVQEVLFDNLGGKTARLGTFPGGLEITGAKSETKGANLLTGQQKSWTIRFDVHYEMQLTFFSLGSTEPVNTGLSTEEFNGKIAAALKAQNII